MSATKAFYQFSEAYQYLKTDILAVLEKFNEQGTTLFDSRNTIKTFDIGGHSFNIKSFRPPHFINKVVYRFFRKSKARRSFENAQYLIEKGFGSPEPVAFMEQFDPVGLKKSFYISKQLKNVFEMKAVIHNPQFAEREYLIQLYTRFHFQLQQAGILFLDNTQGNTLFEKTETGYRLYLVDLNRMKTGVTLSIKERIQNFATLTRDEWIMQQVAKEYANLLGIDANTLSAMLINASKVVFKKRDLKKKWKQRLKNNREK
ncbi:MAG TPA: lipopolysaccharide kinase InaA family protein [Ferruginibacter sp.]|nr:lipopolysaccharide kinase InaA family protein [Ferruginibacter sp.]